MDISLLIVLSGAGLVLLCWIANLAVTAKRGAACRALSRVTYIVAIVTVLVNGVRMAYTETFTMVVANIIALACIIVSFVRSEKGNSDPAENG